MSKISRKPYANSAFSLVEISVVILIIGILIAGISKGVDLYQDLRLATAKSLTLKSRAGRIPDMILWLETVSDKSITGNVADSSPISNWNDINPSSTNKPRTSSAVNSFPTYKKNCLNNLPCLSFDGVDDFIDIETFAIRTKKLTYFVALKPLDVGLSACCKSIISSNANLVSWWDVGDVHFQFNRNSNYYSATGVLSYDGLNYTTPPSTSDYFFARNGIVADNNYIFTAIDNGFSPSIFINGASSGYSTQKTTANSDINKNLAILNLASWKTSSSRSRFFRGNIYEVIIFGRDLTLQERQDVEKYLSQKWGIRLGN